MSVFYYDPSSHFERLFDDAFGRMASLRTASNASQRSGNGTDEVQRTIRPRMDLHEDTANNTVTTTFELPGIKKEDVQIDVHNGRLNISAESKISEEKEQDGYAIRERRFGRISRTIQLPPGVKESEVKAAMENGVLTVTFPRSTREESPKKITVA
ncbi:heat shock protein 16 [Favolaschia claudopus]|uniref:Heat shock protein 16 n=1 Tax=Favolaschia claudopus TaxID=2862362 RepID=A0AAW0C486_9AGAR